MGAVLAAPVTPMTADCMIIDGMRLPFPALADRSPGLAAAREVAMKDV